MQNQKVVRRQLKIKGSISEPVRDYLYYCRHYRYLLSWLFGGINNSSYVDFSCSASAVLIQNRKKSASRLYSDSTGGVTSSADT